MHPRLRLLLGVLIGVAVVHFLVSECPFSPNYDFLLYAQQLAVTEPDPIQEVLELTDYSLNHTYGLAPSCTDLFVEGGSRGGGTNSTLSPNMLQPQPSSLPLCPATPPGLVGPVRVFNDTLSDEELHKLYPDVQAGGHWAPSLCLSRHRVAIVVPYRDREVHLRMLLHNLHGFLSKQQLDYAIFIVEQVEHETFNRAKLMNVGFREALRLYDWQCFVFHDVDLLPEDDRNLYSCPLQPRHMSVAIDKFNYELPYGSIFGGISALTRVQVEKINGFSNDYWGWGGEDDDLSTRVSLAGYKISRYPAKIARYKMIKHSKEKENPVNKCRYKLLYKTKRRWIKDGLSSLNYKLVKVEKRPFYTHLLVDLMEKESRATLHSQGFPKSC